MITALLITVIFIAGSVLALYFWQRAPRQGRSDRALPPPPEHRGLFDAQPDETEPGLSSKEEADLKRARLIERAARRDLAALDDAGGDRNLYNEILDEFVRRAETSHEELRALVTHISESKQLRSNARLARALIEQLKHPADRRAIADALHVSALSDDAAVYEQAVEKSVEIWQAGEATELKSEDLLALIESQYWVLAPEARRSGAGFALRQALERCRRQLAGRARAL
ncbi:MAG TPA: hypothetical protein VF131_02925 [Blastocatellia bacterium]|nr:hypothetical protein [Blastocatellia bacterium]